MVLEAIAEIERLIDDGDFRRCYSCAVPSGEDMKRLFDLSTIDLRGWRSYCGGGGEPDWERLVRLKNKRATSQTATPRGPISWSALTR